MAASRPNRDLRAFCRFLEERGELIRVTEPVDPYLEVTELADRFVKAGESPALLFENPLPGPLGQAAGRATAARTADGRPVPLVINLFASRQRLAWALGCETVDEAVAKIEAPLHAGMPGGLWDKLRLLGKLKEWSSALPKSVARGACQEVVVRGDELERRGLLDLIPVLSTWPEDGGPYITLPLVITRHPETGKRNLGMYRLAGLRRPHDRHALAGAQDRRGALRSARTARRADAGLRGDRRSAGAHLRRDGAAAGRPRRGAVGRLPHRRADRLHEGGHLRPRGSGRSRLRHRRLRRSGRTSRGGTVR